MTSQDKDKTYPDKKKECPDKDKACPDKDKTCPDNDKTFLVWTRHVQIMTIHSWIRTRNIQKKIPRHL
jgi:hypothetical protein